MNKNLVFLFLIGSFFYVEFADGEDGPGSAFGDEGRVPPMEERSERMREYMKRSEERMRKVEHDFRRHQRQIQRSNQVIEEVRRWKKERMATNLRNSTVDSPAWCEVLNTSFYGSHGVQVQCGEGPEKIGWISNNAQLEKIALKVRDKDTGWERTVFRRTDPDRPGVGGTKETLSFNQEGSDGNNFFSQPVSLYIPGGCGSSKIFHTLTLGVLKDNDELKEDEECSWLNESDTNWRSAIKGIKENENIVSIRYALHPDTPVYSDKEGNKQKGKISDFNVSTSVDELHCEAIGNTYVLAQKGIEGIPFCGPRMCLGENAICSSNGREYFEFPEYGCTIDSGAKCPTPKECIFGEGSFYFNESYKSLHYNDARTDAPLFFNRSRRNSRGVR